MARPGTETPGLLDHWRTPYQLGQWVGTIYKLVRKMINFIIKFLHYNKLNCTSLVVTKKKNTYNYRINKQRGGFIKPVINKWEIQCIYFDVEVHIKRIVWYPFVCESTDPYPDLGTCFHSVVWKSSRRLCCESLLFHDTNVCSNGKARVIFEFSQQELARGCRRQYRRAVETPIPLLLGKTPK